MKPLPRNNTSFPAQLYERLAAAKFEENYAFLKYYQKLVREYVNKSLDAKGLLCAWEMGLGKSMVAIALAMDAIDDGRQPLILLTKSLQPNMRKTIIKYVRMRSSVEPDYPLGRLSDADLDTWIAANFSFVSMNASNMISQVDRAVAGTSAAEFDAALEERLGEMLKMSSLNGKFVIVDEAHNLFRAITNGSKNAIAFYEMVQRSDCIIVFLTGTIISNNVFEIVPCFNMIHRGELFPVDYNEFMKLYVGVDGRIKNREKLQNRIMGLVSYVSNKSKPGSALGITEDNAAEFPEQLPTAVEHIPMTGSQYVAYKLARDKEDEEGQRKANTGGKKPRSAHVAAPPPSLTKPKGGQASTYHVRSRQLSNYCPPVGLVGTQDLSAIPPDAFSSPKNEKILSIHEKFPGRTGLVYSQFTGIGGLGSLGKFLDNRGYERVYPPKMGGRDICDGPHIGRAEDYVIPWVGAAETFPWMDDISAITDEHGWWDGALDEFAGGADRTTPMKYAIIDGTVDVKEREWLQDLYNSPDNMHGGLLDILLISSTGAEGLDLKNGAWVAALEPFWNMGRMFQVFFRVVRANSHIALPENERVVQPYILIAVQPEGEDAAVTTDLELYEAAMRDQIGIESFESAIFETSIECRINGEAHCRSCNPTGKPLFTADAARDCSARDPCVPLTEEKILADMIEVDGLEYCYAESAESVYGVRIFEFDALLNGFRPMRESDKRFQSIAAAITSKK